MLDSVSHSKLVYLGFGDASYLQKGLGINMIISIIPARSGSKRIKDKNIRMINGKPLLAYSIEQSLACKLIDKTIVSTDSMKYANIAYKFNATAVIKRPKELAQDESTDLEVMRHVLNCMKDKPDIIVHLRPTYPYRKIEDIEYCIKILKAHSDIDSVKTITQNKDSVFKMWIIQPGGRFFLKKPTYGSSELCSMPDQKLPTTYLQNGCIDVFRCKNLLFYSMIGRNIYGFRQSHNYDINTIEDLKRVRRIMRHG